MFRTLIVGAVAIVGAMSVGSSAFAAPLIAGGFEESEGAPSAAAGDVSTAANPWSGWNNWVSPHSAYYSAAHARTGTQSGKTYSGPNAGIYQSVAATAGMTYEASAWFYNAASDAITSANATEDVRLTFKDSGGVAIGDSIISPAFAPAGNTDIWAQRTVSAVAPLGTTSVEVMLFLNNPDNGGGAMFADDVSLIETAAVPEPAALGVFGGAAMLALLRRRQP
ncbi:MAG TPA: PEP-CTERM sorting domain-containing protein [Tepidisphaeraceae bacterium]|nr:PEP-CTERM sorting domain-containing protein [Tepidisphaeraceae bacterium]